MLLFTLDYIVYTSFQPTVYPSEDFNPVEDAERLKGAMKGSGSDEDEIIAILTKRTNAQRQLIAEEFKNLYDKVILDFLY